MQFVKISTQEIKTIADVRAENPNVSLFETSDLTEFGYAPLYEVEPAPVDGYYWKKTNTAKQENGLWNRIYVQEIILPPPIPFSVSMRQARLALLGAGLLPTVNAAIAAMDGVQGEAARIEWEYATDVVRSSALVSGLSSALGLTSEQLDTLFTTASTL